MLGLFSRLLFARLVVLIGDGTLGMLGMVMQHFGTQLPHISHTLHEIQSCVASDVEHFDYSIFDINFSVTRSW
jgi:hypothetical protein